MDKNLQHRIIAISLPILALLLGGGLFSWQLLRLRSTLHQESVQKVMGVSLQHQIDSISSNPSGGRYAAVIASPQEQPQFLTQLRSYAADASVTITRWAAILPPPPTAGGDKNQPKLPANLQRIYSSLEVSGSYVGVRKFLYSLLCDPRLLTMTNVRWSRGAKPDTTRAALTLTRYLFTQSN